MSRSVAKVSESFDNSGILSYKLECVILVDKTCFKTETMEAVRLESASTVVLFVLRIC